MTGEFEKYLDTLPEDIADIVREYHPGSEFMVNDTLFYLIGISEDKTGEGHHKLMLTEINPFKDYDKAVNGDLQKICIKCMPDFFKISWHNIQ